jgi:hypothetical protein
MLLRGACTGLRIAQRGNLVGMHKRYAYSTCIGYEIPRYARKDILLRDNFIF